MYVGLYVSIECINCQLYWWLPAELPEGQFYRYCFTKGQIAPIKESIKVKFCRNLIVLWCCYVREHVSRGLYRKQVGRGGQSYDVVPRRCCQAAYDRYREWFSASNYCDGSVEGDRRPRSKSHRTRWVSQRSTSNATNLHNWDVIDVTETCSVTIEKYEKG